VYCCLFTTSAETALAVARACSPRVCVGASAAVFDVSGCSRTIGPPDVILREVLALAGEGARAAIAPTVTAAWLLAAARPGTIVAPPAKAPAALAPIPTGWLGSIVDLASMNPPNPLNPSDARNRLAIFERWGLRTLGDLAALPRADIQARLGPVGVRLHQAASGEDDGPFVPMDDAPVFIGRQELEWPIEGLEPLSFVLARVCDRLSMTLIRADRGAVLIRTRLGLVTRESHERVLQLPSPIADARILRTLILLDLESHPPPAAIDVVTVDLDVAPGPIVHGSLIAPTLPTAEDLATLIARLTALMGASRIGAPEVLDTHDARAVGMARFEGHGRAEGKGQRAEGRDGRAEGKGLREEGKGQRAEGKAATAVRRLRLPIPARVETDRQRPARVCPSARGLAAGVVMASSGPWRSSGRWWTTTRGAWDRDEWDVELSTGVVCRLVRHRTTGQWEIEGLLD
jgi:protein ImuB